MSIENILEFVVGVISTYIVLSIYERYLKRKWRKEYPDTSNMITLADHTRLLEEAFKNGEKTGFKRARTRWIPFLDEVLLMVRNDEMEVVEVLELDNN